MSVPQELVSKMMGGAQGAPMAGPPATGAAAPPPSPGQPGIGGTPGGAPQAAPLSGPQEKKGLKVAGMTNVHIAVNMLEEALPAFGSESPEGEKILKAIGMIRSLVGKRDSSDLVPAEVLHMVRRLPQFGGGTSVQQQIMKQMQGSQAPPQAA